MREEKPGSYPGEGIAMWIKVAGCKSIHEPFPLELVVKPHHSMSSREEIMAKAGFERYTKNHCPL